MQLQETIGAHQALKIMRNLSKAGVPFSIEFEGFSTKRNRATGYRKVEKALLRKSFRKEQSDQHDVLINYIDCSDDSNKTFRLPQLYRFNGKKVVL